MTDSSPEERFWVYMTQAQNFARRENFAEAVSRMDLVVDEVSNALAAEEDPTRKGRYAQILLRARKLRDSLQADLDSWNAKIAARRAEVIAGAAEEMERPLPNRPPDVPRP